MPLVFLSCFSIMAPDLSTSYTECQLEVVQSLSKEEEKVMIIFQCNSAPNVNAYCVFFNGGAHESSSINIHV